MSVERKLCDLMAYPHAILFPRARDALAAWCKITEKKIDIPSNCCPALLPFAKNILTINPETGLAPCPVQLYGYRQHFPSADIEIDPLMTGLLGRPFATSTVISFGYAKTIDIGGGGAILTQDESLARQLTELSFFPKVLRQPLATALYHVHSSILEKKKQYEEIENDFGPDVERLPTRPIIPWRFIAKMKEPKRHQHGHAGYYVSHNYPPLPGVTDQAAIEWGNKVINIWQ